MLSPPPDQAPYWNNASFQRFFKRRLYINFVLFDLYFIDKIIWSSQLINMYSSVPEPWCIHRFPWSEATSGQSWSNGDLRSWSTGPLGYIPSCGLLGIHSCSDTRRIWWTFKAKMSAILNNSYRETGKIPDKCLHSFFMFDNLALKKYYLPYQRVNTHILERLLVS